jgi:hypothetical protein
MATNAGRRKKTSKAGKTGVWRPPRDAKMTAQFRVLTLLRMLLMRPRSAAALTYWLDRNWRTIYRDLEVLKAVGLPLETEGVKHTGETYHVRPRDLLAWARPIERKRRGRAQKARARPASAPGGA